MALVSISGTPGSGKTSCGRLLAERLGCRFFSIGTLRGEIAQRHGMTIDELNVVGETEDWTDKEVDEYQRQLGKELKDGVFDGWTSFHFIPHSFKVFLTTDMDVAAQRVFKDQRPDEPHQDDVEGVKRMLAHRFQVSIGRYEKYYGLDILDKSQYDLVIDSTHIPQEEVVEQVLKAMGK